MAVLAITVTGLLGTNAAKQVAPGSSAEQFDNAFWIKTKLPDDLLAGRLNVTTVAKSTAGIPLPTKPRHRKKARTAQLLR
ncbi:hypothetical protein AUC70_08650 [Methyloceanibacter stevinii]|uniref:Uncharacterized protein n=1 Tax=Methyloceanibacter stevinii TaxID=1774970 RepID=A0A1E3VMD0_9HYPH|nr:hypothetical protein [Methyloceanibacter stevinii]ODR94673.1 hypothetical protein AUC70_08650 [Methyloceanibacter stevinii]